MSGCWYSFVRCVGNRADEPRRAHYTTSQIETIKFENLLTLEEQEKASRVPVLTETELQHVREGRLDKLVEDQIILDRERDEKLRQEEEQLRQEEEAYYAAKKEAAKKTKRGLTTITSQPLPTSKVLGTSRSTTYSKLKEDEEDFDKFLKSVKSKHLSNTNSADTGGSSSLPNPLHSITSDDDLSEEEVDFGYWESASLPSSSKRVETNLKDIDLNLL